MTETRADRAARAAELGAEVAFESFRGDLSIELSFARWEGNI